MRSFTLIVALMLVSAACGQLPGVHTEETAGGEFVIEEVPAGEGGATEGQPGQRVVRRGGTSGGGTSGTSGGSGGGAGGGAGGAGGGGSQVTARGGDRTGISNDTITIGIHAPLTGAAPVESEAFQQGKDLYWRWLANDLGRSIHGRNVRVIFRDDQYNPSTAVAVCKDMARQAFLLIGGAGTDQIQACAQFAADAGIPYLSAGVTEAGLELASYFAFTATYADQGPILAQLVYKRLKSLDRYSPNGIPEPDGEVRVAMIRPDTPNFDDAEQGFRAGLQRLGQDLDYVGTTPKADSPALSSNVSQQVQAMKSEGIDVVYPITAPVVTINLVQQGESQAYTPRYVGVGITNNLNQVSNLLCGDKGDAAGFDQATFFSPWPGWPEVMQGRFDPDYSKAAEKYAGDANGATNGGDIILAFWGFSRNLEQMFQAAGADMTRSSFIRTLDAGFTAETGLTPPIDYRRGHFGVREVHRLEVDCSGDRLFHQADAFVSGY